MAEWELSKRDYKTLNYFKRTCRYIDDLLTINNDGFLMKFKQEIYPPELGLTSDSKDDQQVNYLDLHMQISGKKIDDDFYDKRDKFNFTIVNFPNLSGNILTSESYNVFSIDPLCKGMPKVIRF